MIRNRLIFLVAAIGLWGIALGTSSPAGAQESRPVFRIEEITVITVRGRFGLSAEIAETPEQRSFGLQFRTQLSANRGMLFDFETPQPIFMWMKNTLIPLDMIFINSAGRVIGVAENTTPLSMEVIPSGAPVRSVLEVAAGTAANLGIMKGSLVQHRIFGNVPAQPAPAPTAK